MWSAAVLTRITELWLAGLVAAPERVSWGVKNKTVPDHSKKSLPVSAGFISLLWSEYMLGWGQDTSEPWFLF